MMKLFSLQFALLATLACSAVTPAHAATHFDYYVLSLSWSPQYCAESRRNDELQCTRPFAFVAHGLWPQNERGYPQNCSTYERVSDGTIQHMLTIMPSRGLIIHEWRAHGACSGLSSNSYFATVERAYRSIRIPARYAALQDYQTVATSQLKQEFIAANPKILPNGIALQCSGHYLQEVRVCMDTALAPRACSTDVRDRCGSSVVLRPSR